MLESNMESPVARCTVPVEIAGKICEFGLRPDRYFSRVPVDIWRLFRSALTPLPPANVIAGDDLTGCLGMCSGELAVLNRNLADHTVVVSREPLATIGLSTLLDLRLIYNFSNGSFQLADDSMHESKRQRADSPFERRSIDGRVDSYDSQQGQFSERPDDHRFNDSRSYRGDDIRQYQDDRPQYRDDRRSLSPSPYRRNDARSPYHLEADRRPDDLDHYVDERLRSKQIYAQNDRLNNPFGRLPAQEHPTAVPFGNSLDGVTSRDALEDFQRFLDAKDRQRDTFSKDENPRLNRKDGAKNRRVRPQCTKCNKFGHVASNCYAGKNASGQTKFQCGICKKFGHKSAYCRSAKSNSKPTINKPGAQTLNPWESWVLGNCGTPGFDMPGSSLPIYGSLNSQRKLISDLL